MINAWFDGRQKMIEVETDSQALLWDKWEMFLNDYITKDTIIWLEVEREDYAEFLKFINYCFKFSEGVRFIETNIDETSFWYSLACHVGFDDEAVYLDID